MLLMLLQQNLISGLPVVAVPAPVADFSVVGHYRRVVVVDRELRVLGVAREAAMQHI